MSHTHKDEALEDIMSQLGEFGKYQLRQHLLHLLGPYLAGVHMLSMAYTAPTPSHRCRIHDVDVANVSQNLSWYIPIDPKTNEWDHCQVYRTPGDPTKGVKACGGPYVFDNTFYQSSRVIEMELVCDKRWMRALLQSIYMIGCLCGAVTLGSLADSFGRKPIFCISAVLQLIFAIASAFIPTYYWLAVVLFFLGAFGSSGSYVTGFVLSMEMIGSTKRTLCGTMFSFAFSVGVISDSFWGWLIPGNYQYLQLAFAGHSLFLLGHWWFIDESIRWLWGKGRTEDAVRIATKALKVNGKTLVQPKIPADKLPQQRVSEYTYRSTGTRATGDSESTQITYYTHKTTMTDHSSYYTTGSGEGKVVQLSEGRIIKIIGNPHPHPPHAGMVDLFRMPNLRCRTLIMSYAWFANSLSYYGLNFNVGNLPGNPFLMSFLSGISEVPGYLIVIFLLDRWGRRCLEVTLVLLAGIASVIIGFFEPGTTTIVIAMISKLAVSASFGICYNFSAELFPTVIRNSVVGITTMAARGAGMLAPTVILLDEYGTSVPTLVFGGCALLAAFLVMFVPETLNKEMPQTMEDGENFGKGDTAFHTFWNLFKKKKKDNGKQEDSKDNEETKKAER